MKKQCYQVIFQDEYNNLYSLGYYKELKDSLKDINNELSTYGVKLTKKHLKTYPSTFGLCFGICLGDIFDKDDVAGVYIRGFIYEYNDLLKEIKELNK